MASNGTGSLVFIDQTEDRSSQVDSSDLNQIEHEFHLLKTKLKTERPTNKQQLKTAAVKEWKSIRNEETQRLVMSMASILQAVHYYVHFSEIRGTVHTNGYNS